MQDQASLNPCLLAKFEFSFKCSFGSDLHSKILKAKIPLKKHSVVLNARRQLRFFPIKLRGISKFNDMFANFFVELSHKIKEILALGPKGWDAKPA